VIARRIPGHKKFLAREDFGFTAGLLECWIQGVYLRSACL